MIDTINYKNGKVVLIDQTKLPVKLEYVECKNYMDIASAIKTMKIRGAPAIGVAAFYGMALGAQEFEGKNFKEFLTYMKRIKEELDATRPTAVNLFWATEETMHYLEGLKDRSISEIKKLLIEKANREREKDIQINKMIGENGNSLIPEKANILTHCNTGALATAGYGTALGVIRSAFYSGKKIKVWVDETRPVLQGARLTAWELKQEKIPATLITDNTAGFLMKKGLVDLVILGADRVARNGDTANKIGTYSLSILAKAHNIPFYVACPFSTIDTSLLSGESIPIEERDPKEVLEVLGTPIAPLGMDALNMAFDVTPWQNITAIITEKGVLYPPFEESILKLK